MLLEKGRMPPEENLEVVVLTGDGAAYGMGLSVVKQPLDSESRPGDSYNREGSYHGLGPTPAMRVYCFPARVVPEP